MMRSKRSTKSTSSTASQASCRLDPNFPRSLGMILFSWTSMRFSAWKSVLLWKVERRQKRRKRYSNNWGVRWKSSTLCILSTGTSNLKIFVGAMRGESTCSLILDSLQSRSGALDSRCIQASRELTCTATRTWGNFSWSEEQASLTCTSMMCSGLTK